MAFTPAIPNVCVKVSVTTEAQAVVPPTPDPVPHVNSVLVLNMGPGLVFIEPLSTGLENEAVADESMPIPAGAQVPLSARSLSSPAWSIVGDAAATVYFTWGTGEGPALSAAPLVPEV